MAFLAFIAGAGTASFLAVFMAFMALGAMVKIGEVELAKVELKPNIKHDSSIHVKQHITQYNQNQSHTHTHAHTYTHIPLEKQNHHHGRHHDKLGPAGNEHQRLTGPK